MSNQESKTKNENNEIQEKFQLKQFETILEWTGWGSLATALAILVLMVLIDSINLGSETSAIILIAIYLWVVSWGTGKLVKDNPDAWKYYLYSWTAAIALGAILCVLGVTFVPT
ncbi:MAG: hypothetical protein ACUVXA_17260 [Candidatus Jordarchaeum sp.]|uniref:hypothetical protein n=1 Tax=Candidatus Jordarchaeum sp. TaxID=2823881 RepID=UPI00404934D1